MCVCVCVWKNCYSFNKRKVYISNLVFKYIKLVALVEGDRKLPFQQLLHRGEGEGVTLFPRLLPFTIDPYLLVLSKAVLSTIF